MLSQERKRALLYRILVGIGCTGGYACVHKACLHTFDVKEIWQLFSPKILKAANVYLPAPHKTKNHNILYIWFTCNSVNCIAWYRFNWVFRWPNSVLMYYIIRITMLNILFFTDHLIFLHHLNIMLLFYFAIFFFIPPKSIT